MTHHLAQVNIARLLAPLDDPMISEFVHFLGPINELAESSPGFVWRLKDEEGISATEMETPFEDDMLIINMSVWKDVESLRDFAYKTAHSYFVRNGNRWFEKMERPHMALWWVPVGENPSMQDAADKLALLHKEGPSTAAFNFAHLYTPLGESLRK